MRLNKLIFLILLLSIMMQCAGSTFSMIGILIGILITVIYTIKRDFYSPAYIFVASFPFTGLIRNIGENELPSGFYVFPPHFFNDSLVALNLGGTEIQPVIVFLFSSF